MKLWEGNVFTGIGLFTGEVTSNASWNRSYGRVPLLDIRPGTWPGTYAPYWHLVAKHSRPVQTSLLKESPQVTSGGGHWSTIGFQVGGMHPPGMLSCWFKTMTFDFYAYMQKNLFFIIFNVVPDICQVNVQVLCNIQIDFVSSLCNVHSNFCAFSGGVRRYCRGVLTNYCILKYSKKSMTKCCLKIGIWI